MGRPLLIRLLRPRRELRHHGRTGGCCWSFAAGSFAPLRRMLGTWRGRGQVGSLLCRKNNGRSWGQSWTVTARWSRSACGRLNLLSWLRRRRHLCCILSGQRWLVLNRLLRRSQRRWVAIDQARLWWRPSRYRKSSRRWLLGGNIGFGLWYCSNLCRRSWCCRRRRCWWWCLFLLLMGW